MAELHELHASVLHLKLMDNAVMNIPQTSTESALQQSHALVLKDGISSLYQHFIGGEIEAMEFSDLVDAMIECYSLDETTDDLEFCPAA